MACIYYTRADNLDFSAERRLQLASCGDVVTASTINPILVKEGGSVFRQFVESNIPLI